MDILIIGAGLGGLAAAAVLQRRGIRVRVFEQAAQLGEVGAGIQMSANAMKVLDRIGLRAELEPVAVRPLAFEFRRFDSGEHLHRIPLGRPHEERHGAPYFQLHRADLHAALQQAVRAHDGRPSRWTRAPQPSTNGPTACGSRCTTAGCWTPSCWWAPTASAAWCAATCWATTSRVSPARWPGAAWCPPSASRRRCAPTSCPPSGAGRTTMR
jgi:glycine/D-amino acid oxidase-like deaminating enzyme